MNDSPASSYSLTVAICTHNPDRRVFGRVLDALDRQTLDKARWELLVVDNCSTKPLQSELDLSWHPHARVELETTLGLTPARLKAIRRACGSVIVFVDDDNILCPTYLEEVLSFMSLYPHVGAVGPRVDGEYEVPVPLWLTPWLQFLAINTHPGEDVLTTADPRDSKAIPCGAGLCVRREQADGYADQVERNTRRICLDRRGNNLSSSGDTDLVFTVISQGCHVAYNPNMQLVHYMFRKRLRLSYMARLRRSGNMSSHIVRYLHGLFPVTKKPSYVRSMVSFFKTTKADGDWRGYWLKLNGFLGKIMAERYCYGQELLTDRAMLPVKSNKASGRNTAMLTKQQYENACSALSFLTTQDRKYAIYGAGKVGRELVAIVHTMDFKQPAFLIDDHPSGDVYEGVRIVAPDAVAGCEIQEVLLGTTCFQAQMIATLNAHQEVEKWNVIDFCRMQPGACMPFEKYAEGSESGEGASESDDDYAYGCILDHQFLKHQAEQLDTIRTALREGARLENVLTGFDGRTCTERIVEYSFFFNWLHEQEGRVKLLDIGCVLNNRIVVADLEEKCEELWFCNPAVEPRMIDMPVFYHVAKMDEAKFLNESFDLITCMSTIEHIGFDNSQYGDTTKAVYTEPSNQPLFDALELIVKWTRPGGRFMISVPFGKRSVCRHRVTKKTAMQLFDYASLTEAVARVDAGKASIQVNVYYGDESGWHLHEHPEQCDVRYAHGFPAAAAVAILDGRVNEE